MSEEPEIPPLPEYAVDLETELAMGVINSTPDEGIRRMEARIKGLREELATTTIPDYAHKLNAQLIDARQRLAEYTLQRDGTN